VAAWESFSAAHGSDQKNSTADRDFVRLRLGVPCLVFDRLQEGPF
jgi:hypothetical protein